MSYSAEISRKYPTCFLFVIDASGSMDELMDNGRKKSEFVADVLNKTLYQLVIRSTRHDEVRDYFHVGVLAYSENNVVTGFSGQLAPPGSQHSLDRVVFGVVSGCDGQLASAVLRPVSMIEQYPLRIEQRIKKVDDGAGGVVQQQVNFPIWFEPKNSGGTPMCEAMYRTAQVIVDWCNTHPQTYPPTIIHVTDGQSTDGDPEPYANELKSLRTDDGQCLLFNLHIDTGSGASIIFPPSPDVLPDDYSRLLFRMSSTFPPHLIPVANGLGHPATNESRFFGYKAGYEGIADFFDIGTRAIQMR